MLSHTHILAPYTFLTLKEAFEATRQGDLAALQKFVENMQIHVQLIKDEYEQEKEERRQRGLSESFNYGRDITKEYSVNTVKANCYLWYRIYEIAASNNHINIMNLLHRSSLILLDKMSVNEFGILLGNVIKSGSTDSLICMFTEATAYNKSIGDFLKSHIENFMVTAVKHDKLESAKLLIKVFNINFNDDRFLYDILIQRAWLDNQPRMIAFLAEDCNVDKPFILQCLTETLSTGNHEYQPADLVEFVKTIVSKMKSMTIADVVVTKNKPSASPSTYTNAESGVLKNRHTPRVEVELTKKSESVQNSNLIAKDKDELDADSKPESQLKYFPKSFQVEGFLSYEKFLENNRLRVNMLKKSLPFDDFVVIENKTDDLPSDNTRFVDQTENLNRNLPSANTNAKSSILKNVNTPTVEMELSTKVESVQNSNILQLDTGSETELDLNASGESTPIEGFNTEKQRIEALLQKFMNILRKSITTAHVEVAENKPIELPSANNNAKSSDLKNVNYPCVEIELSKKVESVKNSNLIAKDKDELDTNAQLVPKLQSILESFPNNYGLTCNSSDDVKLHIQLINQQITQINASLNYQTLLTKDLHNHRLLMQQLEQIVNDEEVVLVYFMKLKSRLIDCFLAARLISTGLIDRADYLPSDKINKLLEGFSGLLTGIAHFVEFSTTEMAELASSALKSIGEGLHLGHFLKELLPASLHELLSTIIDSQEHCLERLSMISSGKDYTLNGLEYTAETIALALTYLYRPQIVCLTNNGATKFAECSAERVLLLGKEGMVNRSNDWIAAVIVYIGLPAIKQTKNFMEIEIETKPEYHGRWTENGIHCKSGIMCQTENDIYYYTSKHTKHNKYGFRINGSSIAVKIYDMSMLSLNEVSDATKHVSKAYFTNHNRNSFVQNNLNESSDCAVNESSSGHAAASPVRMQRSTTTISDSFILSKLLVLEEHQREVDRRLRQAHDKIDQLELENKNLRDNNSALKSNVDHIVSTVLHISKQQDTHDKHFKTIKKSGIDLDVIEDSGVTLLSTQDFTEANNTGRFFLSEQQRLMLRVQDLELEVSIKKEERKLSNK